MYNYYILCLQIRVTTQNDIQEPSVGENLDGEVQNKPTSTSTYFDAEGTSVELKNEKSSVKVIIIIITSINQ